MYPSFHRALTGVRVDWPAFAPMAATAGFPATDVWTTAARDEGVDQTLETLFSNRLLPATLTLDVDFRGSEELYQQGFERLHEMAQFSTEILCPKFVARLDPSGPLPKAEWRKVQLDRLQAICEVLAEYDARLALEFIGSADIMRLQPHEFLWRMPETLEFIQEAGPNCGMLLDSWHWHYAGATTADILAAGDRIFHVHINDAPEQPFDQVIDKERLMPGQGVIDLKGFLTALDQVGYTGALSVEVFSSMLKTIPPEEGARLGYETTMAVLNSYRLT